MLVNEEEAAAINRSVLADRKTAELYLLNFEREMRFYHEAKEEFISLKAKRDGAIGAARGGKIANPTERIALQGIAFDDSYGGFRWLKAVEIVQRGLGERKNIFIRVRREAERNQLHMVGRGRKGWVVFVQRRYAEEIEKQFVVPEAWVSEITIKRWWQEIVNHTVNVANKI